MRFFFFLWIPSLTVKTVSAEGLLHRNSYCGDLVQKIADDVDESLEGHLKQIVEVCLHGEA